MGELAIGGRKGGNDMQRKGTGSMYYSNNKPLFSGNMAGYNGDARIDLSLYGAGLYLVSFSKYAGGASWLMAESGSYEVGEIAVGATGSYTTIYQMVLSIKEVSNGIFSVVNVPSGVELFAQTTYLQLTTISGGSILTGVFSN